MMLLGVDTGGTFTDFVLYDGHRLRVHKVLSTPKAPEEAILRGIRELGIDPAMLPGLDMIHGSTVATNAVLEGKGVRTVFVTNRGFADMLSIGRQARSSLYDLQPPLPKAPVPGEYCLETGGRLAAGGGVVEDLTDADLEQLGESLRRLAPEAVAITLLFSFLDEEFERRVEGAVPAGVFVSRSSEVLPEYREYERGITTWLNAWVGPLVEGYLRRLKQGLPGARIAVMQSSGNTIDAAQAGRQAVHMLLSGPAGGLAGARFVAERAGRRRLLTFDIGGTSTDVALVDGELQLTSEGRIGPYPVSVPMVDMHTIGAGGGSIAAVDTGGLLQVGPESAGAFPGPACYGQGGVQPTVTDANLLLGRLLPDAFLGGGMALDVAAAREAMAPVAEALSMPVTEAAAGVVRVANEHMARALRVMSVQRGVDPRGLTLVSFGGAGGLHVCALADALGMTEALVPVHAGVLSALGMLVAPRGRELSRAARGLLGDATDEDVEGRFQELHEHGRAALAAEGVSPGSLAVKRSADLRYRGQSFTLNVPWTSSGEAQEAFHRAHQERYGHRMTLPVELVNVRMSLRAPSPEASLALVPAGPAPEPVGRTRLHGIEGEVDVWSRESLVAGQVLDGPALITETVSTTFLAPRWRCMVDPVGNLVLERLR